MIEPSKSPFFVLLLVCLHLGMASSLQADEEPSPEKQVTSQQRNLVVILTDDQGFSDLSINGNPNLRTPHIDRLANDGLRMNHFYVCAVCSPTRAEFLTGRYHTRMGVFATSRGGERFNADELTIAQAFQDAGYATAAYGKWHSGMQWPYHPNAKGFEDYYGFCSGHWGNYFSPMLEHNGEIVQGKGFLPNDLTDHAIDFIEEHQDEPFFVYLPLNTPHSPMQVPFEYWKRFKNKTLIADPTNKTPTQTDAHSRAALAMCENIDDNVGRLIDHLEASNLMGETIVVYFSDNGPNGNRFNQGMRGKKGSTYEGGLKSPLIVRADGLIPAGQVIETVGGAIDLFPTLAELCNVSIEPPKPLDGLSFAESWTGAAVTPSEDGDAADSLEDRILMSHWNGRVSARDSRFRAQLDGQLFDLANDPGETQDVRDVYPEVQARLQKAIADFRDETNPMTAKNDDPRPMTLGHPSAEFTQMPARDATPTGDIKRSSRHPNCTFMQNWTNTKDEIVWNADVVEGGQFEVSMYYAVDRIDVGATIELKCGENTIETKIDTANETRLFGENDDRSPRTEGLVKDWQPMMLGTIAMESGPQRISLRALDVPGEEVAQMRLLLFKRVD
ncbi:MAG: arylsulfatase [Planctomycetota bacterium]